MDRVIAAVVLSLGLCGAAFAQTQADPEAASGREPKPLVTAETEMIVAANPHAARAGLDMMEQGGSAADAAIAALLVLNVVEPQSSGIGGGAFALVHQPDGDLTTFDARETAPAAATPGMFLQEGEPLPFFEAVASGHSVGVPALVRLMEGLHGRYGQLDWMELFQPAIRLAKEGFEVSPRLATSVAEFASRLREAPAAAVFLPEGRPLEEGATLKQPELAETLEELAREGPAAFYQGRIAAAIVEAVNAEPRPGGMQESDLAEYQVVERSPVCLDYRAEWRVCGMGPPSSGATTVGQILGLMAAFEPGEGGARTAHLFAEASRLAYADRAKYLADSDFVDVPVKGLLDGGYLAERAKLIDPETTAEGEAEAGEPPHREGRLLAPDGSLGSPGTTHLSVIDEDGLALSITASIETAFGSGRMAAGFLLNNQLTDFSFLPESPEGDPITNAVAPGKRPRSSMAPTIVYLTGEAAPAVMAGSPGGSRIPEYVAGALIEMLDFSRDPAEAVADGHVSQRNRQAVTLEEGAHPAELAEALAAMGHVVEQAELTSGLHVIRRAPDGTLQGGADPRREGAALGN